MSIPFLNKAYFSTNVGIGLDTSIAQLDVTSATTSSVQNTVLMLKGDSAQDQNDSMTVDMDFYMEDNNTVTGIPQGRIGLVGSGTPSQAYEAAGRLAFYTTTRAYPTPVLTERMRIDGVGNVGIGTTAPLSKLDVNDSAKSAFTGTNEMALRIRGDKTTDYYTGLGFSNGDDADSGRIAVKRTATGSVMTFGTSNAYASGITNEAMVIDQVGNVGIGTTNPTEKLVVNGSTITTGGAANENNGTVRVSNPGGAAYNGSGTVTGAFAIELPVTWTNTMVSMRVVVYDYNDNESFELQVGGYTYLPTTQWYNSFAYLISEPGEDRNFSVRFGYNSNNKCVIYIGELTSQWSYPKCVVTEFVGGQASPTAANWADGWDIGIESTAFESVDITVSNTQIANWKRSGQNLYYASGTGNVGVGTTSPASKFEIGGSSVSSFTGTNEMPFRITTDTTVNYYTGLGFSTGGGMDIARIAMKRGGSGSSIHFGTSNNYGSGITTEAMVLDYDGDLTTAGDLTVTGGDITLGGTGRIQGVDTVSASTDAANKAYVDAHGGGIGPFLPLTAGSTKPLTGELYLNQGSRVASGENITFYDHDGVYPSATGGFKWDLNNDQALIYAQQPAADYIDFVFKIKDNVASTDRFVYWIDSWSGETDDAFPLYMDGNKTVFNYPGFYGTGNSKDIDFYLIGNNQSSISNAYFFGDAGNGRIGIGTTTPSKELDVTGEVNIAGGDGLFMDGDAVMSYGGGPLIVGDWDGGGFDTKIIGGSGGTYVNLISSGVEVNANATFGATTRNVDTIVKALTNDSHVAGFEAMGASQGTGYFYAGQASNYGGGMFYNGDGSPTFASGESVDTIGFYRRSNNSNFAVFDYSVNSSTVNFKGDIQVIGTGDSYFAGNLGIGTTNPSSILHIEDTTPILKIVSTSYFNDSFIEMGNGALADAGKISCFNNPGISALELKFDNGSAGDARIRVGHRYLDFGIDSGTAMYINSSKNVGIGTTTPNNALSVHGDDKYISTDATAYPWGATNTIGVRMGTHATSSGGEIDFRRWLGGGTLHDSIRIAQANSGATNWGMAFYASTEATSVKSSTLRMFINGDSGRVGIGTATPASLLHLSTSTGDTVLTIEADSLNNNENQNPRIDFKQDGGAVVSKIGINGQTGVEFSGALENGSYFGTSSGYSLQFITNNTARITVKSGGHVGIGTTNPDAALEVLSSTSYETIKMTNNETTAAQRVGLVSQHYTSSEQDITLVNGYCDASNSYLSLGGSSGVNNAIKTIRFFTGTNTTTLNGTERMRISNTGNVGINQTNPISQLEVNHNSLYTGSENSKHGIKIGGQVTGDQNLILGADTTNTVSYVQSVVDNTVVGVLALNPRGGNVAIGAATASYKLDVSGTGRFTSTVTATNFILSSDERLKENIKELQPKNIDAKWKSFNVKNSDEGYRVGVIAQELEETNPEFVETNEEGFKSVKYIDLLISKIAELEDRIKQLEK